MRANSLDLKKVSIHDSFWSKHVDLVRNAIIPYQWEAMNDRIPDAESSHCLENFKTLLPSPVSRLLLIS